jgi:hypothetical protein
LHVQGACNLHDLSRQSKAYRDGEIPKWRRRRISSAEGTVHTLIAQNGKTLDAAEFDLPFLGYDLGYDPRPWSRRIPRRRDVARLLRHGFGTGTKGDRRLSHKQKRLRAE